MSHSSHIFFIVLHNWPFNALNAAEHRNRDAVNFRKARDSRPKPPMTLGRFEKRKGVEYLLR